LLRACFGTAPLNWQVLQAQTISDFVQQEAATRRGGGRQLVTAGVRAVLRFLVFGGERSPGLEAAAPPQRQWTHAPLPRRLTTEEVEQVLAAYDDTPPTSVTMPSSYCLPVWDCEPMKSLRGTSLTSPGMRDGDASVPVRLTASASYRSPRQLAWPWPAPAATDVQAVQAGGSFCNSGLLSGP
jgi:hypothetical protein